MAEAEVEVEVEEGQATKIVGGPLQHGENTPIPLAGESGTTNGGVPLTRQPQPGGKQMFSKAVVAGADEEASDESTDNGSTSSESENDDDEMN